MDREKVIKALECRKNADKRCGNPCEDIGLCHYATVIRGLDGEIYRPFICDRERICADAITLLKEQEAKPMIENERGWNCPSCGLNLIGKSASGYPCYLIDLPEDEPIHFCPMCGQAVKWK